MSLNSAATLLLIAAGLLQLSFFGILPQFGFKPLGDAVLIIFVFLVGKGLTRAYNRSAWSRVCYGASLAFLLLVLLWLGYSLLLWGGDVLLTVRWARRWLIAGIYFLLIASAVPKLLNWKLLYLAILGGALVTAVFIVAGIYGYLSLPGVTIHPQFQGTDFVIKSFNPGNYFLVAAPLLSFFALWHARLSLKKIGQFGVFLVIFISLIAFRTWWIIVFISVPLTLFLVNFRFRLSPKTIKLVAGSLFFTAVIIAVSGALYYLSLESNAPWAVTVKWLYSAFVALGSNSDTVQYRYVVDVLRLIQVWESGDRLYQIFGIGFVADQSPGYYQLGFTSESIDSGWVEVLLTGGLFFAAVLVGFWLLHLLRLRQLYQQSGSTYVLAILALWLVHGLLMISHNPLLWDLGFVPLTWVYLFTLGRLNSQKRHLEEKPLSSTRAYSLSQSS